MKATLTAVGKNKEGWTVAVTIEGMTTVAFKALVDKVATDNMDVSTIPAADLKNAL